MDLHSSCLSQNPVEALGDGRSIDNHVLGSAAIDLTAHLGALPDRVGLYEDGKRSERTIAARELYRHAHPF